LTSSLLTTDIMLVGVCTAHIYQYPTLPPRGHRRNDVGLKEGEYY